MGVVVGMAGLGNAIAKRVRWPICSMCFHKQAPHKKTFIETLDLDTSYDIGAQYANATISCDYTKTPRNILCIVRRTTQKYTCSRTLRKCDSTSGVQPSRNHHDPTARGQLLRKTPAHILLHVQYHIILYDKTWLPL